MRRFFVLHARMQALLRAWDAADAGSTYAGAAANVIDLEFLRELQAALGDPLLDDAALRARLDANFARLEAFARAWQQLASERHPSLARFVSASGPPGEDIDVGVLRVSPVPLPA
jgi:hypothetical protein